MSLNEKVTNQPQDPVALEHIFVHLSWKTWHPKSYMFHHQKTCKARVKAINYSREQVMRSLHCSFQGTSAYFSNSNNGDFAWTEKNKTKPKLKLHNFTCIKIQVQRKTNYRIVTEIRTLNQNSLETMQVLYDLRPQLSQTQPKLSQTQLN
jgi:hypothetical protein